MHYYPTVWKNGQNKRKKLTSSKIQNIIFPDIFIEHDTPENQYKKIGMDAQSIERKILSIFMLLKSARLLSA